VLNWNGWEDTFRCLASVRDAAESSNVWLVDNGSTVDRSAEAAAVLPGLRILRWTQNYGFAGGYNRALRIAAAEGHAFAYLLNNDCTVRPGFLRAVAEVVLADAGLAAVGSCIVYETWPEYAIFDGKYHPPRTHRLEAFGVRPAQDLNGAGMLVRLSTFETSGYFDERFFCYAEETQWCGRVLADGWRIAISSDSIVLHRREGSDVDGNAQYYRTRNAFLLLERLALWRRAAWKIWLIDRAAGEAYEAWVAGTSAHHAIGAGVKDGILGRFGKRRSTAAKWMARLLLAWGSSAMWRRRLAPRSPAPPGPR
jgi:hypothetical protein